MNATALTPIDATSDTRRAILRAARELIQTRSYLGFSFQDLADQVGIRKASLYHHFPSKEALGIEVLERDMQRFDLWTQSLADSPAPDQILAYIGMFRDVLGAGRRVCVGGALSPGWGSIEPGLQAAVQRLRAQQITWLTGVLGQLPAVQAGSLPPGALATQLFALCQGALVSARISGQAADFDLALAPFIQTLQLR